MVQEDMSLKDMSYLELWQPLCSVELNHLCNFGRRHHEKQFCEIVLNLDQWFKRCSKDISYLELWWPFCSVKRNHLCNFSRGHYEQQFCEFISKLGQWFRRCLLKDSLSGALSGLWFSGAEPSMQF